MNTFNAHLLNMAGHLTEVVKSHDWSAFALDDDRGEDGGMSTVIIIAGLVAAAGIIVAAIAAMANNFAGKLEGLG